MDYRAFDIHIAREGDGRYRLQLVDSPKGNMLDTPLSVEIPVTEPAFLAPIQYLSGLVARPDDTKLLGEQIREILFPGEVWERFKDSRREIQANRGLRVRIQLDKNAPELGIIPWEYCFHQAWNEFFALRPTLPIVRYIGMDYDPPDLGCRRPRLLVAMASPDHDDLAALDEADEESKVRALLASLAGQIDADFLPGATYEGVKELLLTPNLSERYDIFHFLGHGLRDEESGRGALAFEDQNGKLDEIDHEELKVLLQAAGVKLVVLTACETAMHAEGDIFKGVGQSLVQSGIPAVIAMQFLLEYNMARHFIYEFYSSLASGEVLDTALTYARMKVHKEEQQKISWGIPVLFMQSRDGRLWLRENAQETEDLVEAKTASYQELQQENADESTVDDRLRDALLTLNFTPQLNMLEDFRRARRAGAFLISIAPEIMAEMQGLELGPQWLLNRLLNMVQLKTKRHVRKLRFAATSFGLKPRLCWAELARSLAMPNPFSQKPASVARQLIGQLETHHVALIFSNAGLLHLNMLKDEVWPVLDEAVRKSKPETAGPATTLLAFIVDGANQIQAGDIAPIRRLPPVSAISASELKSWYEHSLALLPESLQLLEQGYEAILIEDDGHSNQGIPDLVLLRIAELADCWPIIDAIKE